jgi:hypothetical protein
MMNEGILESNELTSDFKCAYLMGFTDLPGD